MSIKFRQGWTDIEGWYGHIIFFDVSWEFVKGSYYSIMITLFNFSVQIDIG